MASVTRETHKTIGLMKTLHYYRFRDQKFHPILIQFIIVVGITFDY